MNSAAEAAALHRFLKFNQCFKEHEDPQSFQEEMNKTVFMGTFMVQESDGNYSVRSEIGKKMVPQHKFNRALDTSKVFFRLQDSGPKGKPIGPK